jgi:hypothetical protein
VEEEVAMQMARAQGAAGIGTLTGFEAEAWYKNACRCFEQEISQNQAHLQGGLQAVK